MFCVSYKPGMFSSERKLDQQIIEIVSASTAENLSIEFVRDKFRFKMRSFSRSTPRHQIGLEAMYFKPMDSPSSSISNFCLLWCVKARSEVDSVVISKVGSWPNCPRRFEKQCLFHKFLNNNDGPRCSDGSYFPSISTTGLSSSGQRM